MLDPGYLSHAAEGAESIASDLHGYIISRIIRRMAARIGRGAEHLLSASDRWQIRTLQEAGYLLEEITAELAKYTGRAEEEIRAAMEDAGVKAMEADNRVYEAAGLSPLPLPGLRSPAFTRLILRNYKATVGEWNNYTRTTAQAAQRLYIDACDKAYNQVMSGAVPYTQAVIEAVETVAAEGVYVRYPGGRRDTVETAVARAVRTGVAQAAGDIALERMEEMDWDTILVSAHVGARTGDGGQNPGNHSWWQGKFYSRTGRDKRFPNFYECTGYGTGEGLSGYNCRHSFGSGDGEHNPFEGIDPEENARVERLEKRQREMERRIRGTKREMTGLKEAVDSAEDPAVKSELERLYRDKAGLLQRQNEAYQRFCKENHLRTQNERLQIAKWDRKQAAAAVRGEGKGETAARLSVIPVKRSKVAAAPNSITQRTGRKGGIDRNFYGDDGRQILQISNNGHGHKEEEMLGKHGEHAHDYFWDENGNMVRGKARELTAQERKDNEDIL